MEDRLYEFNSAATGITDGEWLAIFVRDEDQRIVAGICGNTWGGCAEIRQFWVEEARRKQGLGTRLLGAAEQEARRRGCRQMVLMTFSFQAPAFYAKHGFGVVTGTKTCSCASALTQPADPQWHGRCLDSVAAAGHRER
jgi:GNAT superfamily N-acetyltransferase